MPFPKINDPSLKKEAHLGEGGQVYQLCVSTGSDIDKTVRSVTQNKAFGYFTYHFGHRIFISGAL